MSGDGDAPLLTVAVVLNGRRLECTVPGHLTCRELKAQLVAEDGHGTTDPVGGIEGGAHHLLGPFVFRGRKLDDESTLQEAGVRNRDKLMISYMPSVKDLLTRLSAIRAETASLEAQVRAGERVHPELFTRQLLKLDALEMSELTGEAKEVLRALRKQDLAHVLKMEGANSEQAQQ